MGYTHTAVPSEHTGEWIFSYTLLMMIVIGVVTACGMVDYSVHRENFNGSTRTGEALATIRIHYAEETEPYPMSVSRSYSGYMVEAPLYRDDEGGKISFTAGTHSSSGNYVGIRGRFEF